MKCKYLDNNKSVYECKLKKSDDVGLKKEMHNFFKDLDVEDEKNSIKCPVAKKGKWDECPFKDK